MRPLNKLQSIVFVLGAILMAVGAGLTIVQFPLAAWVYAVGAICFASMQMLQRYDGPNYVIRRLRRMMILSDVLFLVAGVLLFANADSWKLFFRAVANVTLTTFALSINLDSSRFDFSLGAVAMLSATVAGTLAQPWNIGPWATLAAAVLVAALLGLVHGGVYVITRIPPIIVSLGMALFYEGCAFAFTGGKGVSLVTRTDIIGFSTIFNYILVTAVTVALVVLLFDYTRFGAHYRALAGG